jgi:hypothetical protein
LAYSDIKLLHREELGFSIQKMYSIFHKPYHSTYLYVTLLLTSTVKPSSLEEAALFIKMAQVKRMNRLLAVCRVPMWPDQSKV